MIEKKKLEGTLFIHHIYDYVHVFQTIDKAICHNIVGRKIVLNIIEILLKTY